MADFNLNAPKDASALGRLIDRLCWGALLIVISVVIAGLVRRAHYEHSYALAAAMALFGAFVLFVGLAQQAIAARDLATWRVMAKWQLRAARERAGLDGALHADSSRDMDEDQARYYALLSDILIEEMMSNQIGGAERGD